MSKQSDPATTLHLVDLPLGHKQLLGLVSPNASQIAPTKQAPKYFRHHKPSKTRLQDLPAELKLPIIHYATQDLAPLGYVGCDLAYGILGAFCHDDFQPRVRDLIRMNFRLETSIFDWDFFVRHVVHQAFIKAGQQGCQYLMHDQFGIHPSRGHRVLLPGDTMVYYYWFRWLGALAYRTTDLCNLIKTTAQRPWCYGHNPSSRTDLLRLWRFLHPIWHVCIRQTGTQRSPPFLIPNMQCRYDYLQTIHYDTRIVMDTILQRFTDITVHKFRYHPPPKGHILFPFINKDYSPGSRSVDRNPYRCPKNVDWKLFVSCEALDVCLFGLFLTLDGNEIHTIVHDEISHLHEVDLLDNPLITAWLPYRQGAHRLLRDRRFFAVYAKSIEGDEINMISMAERQGYQESWARNPALLQTDALYYWRNATDTFRSETSHWSDWEKCITFEWDKWDAGLGKAGVSRALTCDMTEDGYQRRAGWYDEDDWTRMFIYLGDFFEFCEQGTNHRGLLAIVPQDDVWFWRAYLGAFPTGRSLWPDPCDFNEQECLSAQISQTQITLGLLAGRF